MLRRIVEKDTAEKGLLLDLAIAVVDLESEGQASDLLEVAVMETGGQASDLRAVAVLDLAMASGARMATDLAMTSRAATGFLRAEKEVIKFPYDTSSKSDYATVLWRSIAVTGIRTFSLISHSWRISLNDSILLFYLNRTHLVTTLANSPFTCHCHNEWLPNFVFASLCHIFFLFS